jgi:hypothetical protein
MCCARVCGALASTAAHVGAPISCLLAIIPYKQCCKTSNRCTRVLLLTVALTSRHMLPSLVVDPNFLAYGPGSRRPLRLGTPMCYPSTGEAFPVPSMFICSGTQLDLSTMPSSVQLSVALCVSCFSFERLVEHAGIAVPGRRRQHVHQDA